MSRRVRIVLTIVAAVVAIDVALRLLGSLTGGTPGGPRSSSYATGPTGLGAYAELLARDGHRTDRLRKLPHEAALGAGSTVLLLDPASLARADAVALLRFVRSGGRLVAGGRGVAKLAPHRVAPGLTSPRLLAPLPGVRHVSTAGEQAWRGIRDAQPLLGRGGRVVLARRRIGAGTLFLLADPSPLQNRLLARTDNAALGLVLAGSRARQVTFLETYHGYGKTSGLRALPLAWKLMLAGSFLAALVYMVARGRRLGPPETLARELPPPRREYVDSLAAVLGRTRNPEAAVAPVKRHARDAVLRRAALPDDADDEDLVSAARRVGLTEAEADALVRPVRSEADVVAVGRALSRIGQDLTGR